MNCHICNTELISDFLTVMICPKCAGQYVTASSTTLPINLPIAGEGEKIDPVTKMMAQNALMAWQKGYDAGEKSNTPKEEGEKMEMGELPTPIGDFILAQKDLPGVVGNDGTYWHYSQVCTLLTRLEKSLIKEGPTEGENKETYDQLKERLRKFEMNFKRYVEVTQKDLNDEIHHQQAEIEKLNETIKTLRSNCQIHENTIQTLQQHLREKSAGDKWNDKDIHDAWVIGKYGKLIPCGSMTEDEIAGWIAWKKSGRAYS